MIVRTGAVQSAKECETDVPPPTIIAEDARKTLHTAIAKSMEAYGDALMLERSRGVDAHVARLQAEYTHLHTQVTGLAAQKRKGAGDAVRNDAVRAEIDQVKAVVATRLAHATQEGRLLRSQRSHLVVVEAAALVAAGQRHRAGVVKGADVGVAADAVLADVGRDAFGQWVASFNENKGIELVQVTKDHMEVGLENLVARGGAGSAASKRPKGDGRARDRSVNKAFAKKAIADHVLARAELSMYQTHKRRKSDYEPAPQHRRFTEAVTNSMMHELRELHKEFCAKINAVAPSTRNHIKYGKAKTITAYMAQQVAAMVDPGTETSPGPLALVDAMSGQKPPTVQGTQYSLTSTVNVYVVVHPRRYGLGVCARDLAQLHIYVYNFILDSRV